MIVVRIISRDFRIITRYDSRRRVIRIIIVSFMLVLVMMLLLLMLLTLIVTVVREEFRVSSIERVKSVICCHGIVMVVGIVGVI